MRKINNTNKLSPDEIENRLRENFQGAIVESIGRVFDVFKIDVKTGQIALENGVFIFNKIETFATIVATKDDIEVSVNNPVLGFSKEECEKVLGEMIEEAIS